MAATPVAITVHHSLNHGTGTDHPGPMIVTSKCRACEMNCSFAERIVHERVSLWPHRRLDLIPISDTPSAFG